MDAETAVPAPGFVRTPDQLGDRALTAALALTVAATGDDTGGSTGVIEEVVAPGGGPPLHIHHAADELFNVVSGWFTFQIGDLRATGGPGTIAFAARRTPG